MFFRALLAFVTLPGVFAFFLPPLIGHFDPWNGSHRISGIIVVCIGSIILFWCIRVFYVSGKGTLAPWEPPERLVVIGLYHYVRNPMYIGVLLVVLGWSIFFFSPLLLLYTGILATGFHIRIINYEEPHLKKQFREDWEVYQKKDIKMVAEDIVKEKRIVDV